MPFQSMEGVLRRAAAPGDQQLLVDVEHLPVRAKLRADPLSHGNGEGKRQPQRDSVRPGRNRRGHLGDEPAVGVGRRKADVGFRGQGGAVRATATSACSSPSRWNGRIEGDGVDTDRRAHRQTHGAVLLDAVFGTDPHVEEVASRRQQGQGDPDGVVPRFEDRLRGDLVFHLVEPVADGRLDADRRGLLQG